MWLILFCGDGCASDSAPQLARAAEWSAERALAGIEDEDGWPLRWIEAGWLEGLPELHFQTQRECLRALRREMPEQDIVEPYPGGGWESSNVIHHPDYVEKFGAVGREPGRANMMRTYYWACFREAPRVG